ncbi:MAG: diguanylate cyclase [Actinomycetes bacterium]
MTTQPNSPGQNAGSRIGRLVQALTTTSDPRSALPKPQQRRLVVLTWLQVSILVCLAAGLVTVFVADSGDSARRGEYSLLIAGLAIPTLLSLATNRAGHYRMSASLLIAAAVAAPWFSLIMDPKVLKGDFVPLAYVLVSVMLSAMLMRTRVTATLATVQWLGLASVAILAPPSTFNWASLLSLVFFVSLICVLYNVVSQRDLQQINDQTRLLVHSEAELREQTIRDPLTSLFNRRYLEEILPAELARANRQGLPLGVIIVDVDHFKQLNDTLGHAGGDAVLQNLGNLLTENVRASDIACRLGGDEFVLILPETSREVICERADDLLKCIRTSDQRLPLSDRSQVTASAGVAVFPDNGCTVVELLQAADSALYCAKSRGRDRLSLAGSSYRSASG